MRAVTRLVAHETSKGLTVAAYETPQGLANHRVDIWTIGEIERRELRTVCVSAPVGAGVTLSMACQGDWADWTLFCFDANGEAMALPAGFVKWAAERFEAVRSIDCIELSRDECDAIDFEDIYFAYCAFKKGAEQC